MGTLEDTLKSIKIDQARAILVEAIAGDFKDGDIPDTDEEIVQEAMYWYEEAFKANQVGIQLDAVKAILNIAEGNVVSFPTVEVEKLRDEPVNNAIKVEPVNEDVVIQVGPVVEAQDYDHSIKHNLPVPKDWEGTPEDFPRDISELTDRNVRRLSGEYNAYLSRAKWLLALAISDLANSTHLRDHFYRLALKKVSRVDPSTDKAKLKEVIDAEAREDVDFAAYDESVLQHQKDVTMLKALVDIYSGNVDRLSREWTMRQDEYEKS